MPNEPLRVVTFNFVPIAYNLLTRWIHETNNKHVLAVTTPGPTTRPTPAYIDVVKAAPRNVDVLVTTRLRRVATPLIRELEPDLIMCFSFPYRLTPEIISIPKIGAVNLHPAILPANRGPNVFRMFYNDDAEYGVTIHWMDEEFDTGKVLSQSRDPMPQEINPEAILSNWMGNAYVALCEGMEKALAGDKGATQDNSQATYAAPFTEEEYWLDWNDSRRTLQLKHMALSIGESQGAKAYLDAKPYIITTLEKAEHQNLSGQAGQILAREDESLIIQVGDGLLRIQVESFDN